jgi:hypothetical protein
MISPGVETFGYITFWVLVAVFVLALALGIRWLVRR